MIRWEFHQARGQYLLIRDDENGERTIATVDAEISADWTEKDWIEFWEKTVSFLRTREIAELLASCSSAHVIGTNVAQDTLTAGEREFVESRPLRIPDSLR